MEKRETIAEGLGLDSDWEILNEGKCKRCLEDPGCPTISSSMEKRISQLQEEEMGVSTTPSNYEKKLVMAGFEFAKYIINTKQEALAGGVKSVIDEVIEKIKRDIEKSEKSGGTPRFRLHGAPPGLLEEMKRLGLDKYIGDQEEEDED